jgi:hypothetical protein
VVAKTTVAFVPARIRLTIARRFAAYASGGTWNRPLAFDFLVSWMPQLKWTMAGCSRITHSSRCLSTLALSPPLALGLITTALPSSRFATIGAYPRRIESPTSTILGNAGAGPVPASG